MQLSQARALCSSGLVARKRCCPCAVRTQICPDLVSAAVVRSAEAPQHSAAAPQRDLAIAKVASCVAAASAALLMWAAPGPALAVPPGKADVSLPELVQIVKDDFVKRKYLVTGDMTFSVYKEDTWFHDSASDFDRPGVEKWAASVKGFLDGDKSKMVLTGPVTLNERDRTITFEGWKMVNFYKLPACPHTSPFSGKTVLRLDPVDNLIIEHSEEWDDPPGDVVKGLKLFDCDYNPPGFD